MDLIKQVGYMGFEVSQLQEWETFATDILGLTKTDETPQGFNLALDQYKRRFYLTHGPADDVSFIGFEVENEFALNQLAEHLSANKIKVTGASSDILTKRMVKGLISCQDPCGVPLEFYYGPEKNENPPSSAKVASGFVGDQQGFGHVVVTCHKPEENHEFYLNTRGFKLSDKIHLDFGHVKFDITFTPLNNSTLSLFK